jgi:hypothetical protein
MSECLFCKLDNMPLAEGSRRMSYLMLGSFACQLGMHPAHAAKPCPAHAAEAIGATTIVARILGLSSHAIEQIERGVGEKLAELSAGSA